MSAAARVGVGEGSRRSRVNPPFHIGGCGVEKDGLYCSCGFESVGGRAGGARDLEKRLRFEAVITRYRRTLRTRMSTFHNRETGRRARMTICKPLNIGWLLDGILQAHSSTFSHRCFRRAKGVGACMPKERPEGFSVLMLSGGVGIFGTDWRMGKRL
jgi:hypothetical protein